MAAPRGFNLLSAAFAVGHRRFLATSSSSVSAQDFGKLMVANRGEIACRIFTTAKRLGIPTVAVFSEADRGAAHVSLAGEAFCIGPAPARDSYLRQDRILQVAAAAEVGSIHPGYGFLSENSNFAEACEAAGIAFVGPPAAAIDAMGDKSRAKATMAAAGVPVVPGYHGTEQSDEFLAEEAQRVGFPLLVKAVMGGGGKGMKLAQTPSDFLTALHSARRESQAAFGDERVLLERFIPVSRHVEVQVMADAHGDAVYLAERDCSVQRRHQKVIEEAPAPGISPEFRASIGGAAVAAAKAVGYRSAGTVEFILDASTGEYFFMEMNTRLQVEHPVTEAVMGVDLVELQLQVAAGHSLSSLGLHQANLSPVGHSFEARLYAENPAKNFLPAGGIVARWRPPPGATFFSFGRKKDGADCAAVRVDSGVREGDVVGVNYDPMIAKLVTKGPDRASALKTLREALASLQVSGLPTNAEFVRRVTLNAEFQAGAVDTSFIARHEAELLGPTAFDAGAAALASSVFLALDAGVIRPQTTPGASQAAAAASQPSAGPWAVLDSFRVNHDHTAELSVIHAGSGRKVLARVRLDRDGSREVKLQALPADESAGKITTVVGGFTSSASPAESNDGGKGSSVHVSALRLGRDWAEAEVDGWLHRASWSVHTHGDEEILDLWIGGVHHQFRRPVPRRWARVGAAAEGSGGAAVVSPMPGRIIKVFVEQGKPVEEGDEICAVEAMKMEHVVRAVAGGIVEELHAFEGAQVEDGELLAVVAAASEREKAAEV